ncbi:glycoside hydrolase family 15 protein [Candidatus Saccharibacteria bacterium]|nr:glycoside hydrolase family 15 protein [Candidatus Saccharibacteria bacterium]
MTRPVVLSNGSMHVGINRYAMVHDFFYPYVGLENHATADRMRHRIGVWVDNQFTWLDDKSWRFTYGYEPEALIGLITAHHERLGITLKFHDTVDSEYDAFLRNIHIVNSGDQQRSVRLFMHQVFRISNSLSGDTAQYLPGENAILHYKGHRAFVVGAVDNKGVEFDQHAIGIFGIEGKEGTFRDAEDGELSGNNVEHGRVDTVIRCVVDVPAHDSAIVNYWVACGKTTQGAILLHRQLKKDTVAHRQAVTEQSWRYWLGKSGDIRASIDADFKDSFTKSLLITKSHVDSRGGVIASTDTTMLNYSRDSYTYCWPRDGAYTMWPLLRLGYKDELQRFFEFCRRGLTTDGFLMHKYQPDGAIGSSWHAYVYAGKAEPPIQEDETAIVLFLCGEYYRQTGDEFFLKQYYENFIKKMANFLCAYVDEDTKLPHASYDLWEEKFLTSTYTVATVYGGLVTAVDLAELVGDQHSATRWQAMAEQIATAARSTLYNKERKFFYKGIRVQDDGLYYDDVIDLSSFYGAFMFGLFPIDSPEVKESYETICREFGVCVEDCKVTPMPRYEHDRYDAVDEKGANPWFITTLWIAQYYFETGRVEDARVILAWVRDSMMGSGVLSEQINPYTQEFISVAPLTWSQAEYINALLDMVATNLPDGQPEDAKS